MMLQQTEVSDVSVHLLPQCRLLCHFCACVKNTQPTTREHVTKSTSKNSTNSGYQSRSTAIHNGRGAKMYIGRQHHVKQKMCNGTQP